MSKSTEIAVISDDGGPDMFPALYVEEGSDLSEALQENFGGEGIQPGDLERVTVPAGGALSWEVPTIDGEGDSVKTLEGVIVSWARPRAYWDRDLEETGGGQPPDCTSDDGVHGSGMYGPGSEDNPTGACETCPMNEWGSGRDGRGKACKEMRVLYLLQEGNVLPVTVTLPPTSIAPLRRYMLRLANQGIPYYGVVTKLALEKVTGQYTYSVVKPSIASRLDKTVQGRAKEYGEMIRGAVSGTAAQDASAAQSEAITGEG